MVGMLPVLVSVGWYRLYSFGVFMFLGLFLGLFWWWRLGRDEHIDESKLFDTGFLLMFVFFAMSRIGYVVSHWDELRTLGNGLAMLAYPGMSYWVGVVACGILLILIARAREWEVWKLLDIFVVATSLVMVFASIGGLLNGSNPGIEVSRFGLLYPGTELRVFPIDLLNIVWFLVLFGVVSRVRKNFRFYRWYKGDQSSVKDGLAFLVYLGMVSLYYVVRAYLDDGLVTVGGLRVMQMVGLIGFVFSVVMIYIRSGRNVTDDWMVIRGKITPRKQGRKKV